MPYLKLTNVNYYHGGGKTPRRIRHNQNYRLWNIDANEVSKWLDDGGRLSPCAYDHHGEGCEGQEEAYEARKALEAWLKGHEEGGGG